MTVAHFCWLLLRRHLEEKAHKPFRLTEKASTERSQNREDIQACADARTGLKTNESKHEADTTLTTGKHGM